MPSDAEKAAAIKAYGDYIDKALKGGSGRWHVSDAVVAALEAAERVRRIDGVVREIDTTGPEQVAEVPERDRPAG